MSEARTISVVDSHTAGEPTRVIVSGGPNLGPGNMAERRDIFRQQYDEVRTAILNEPRGWPVLVGAILVEPTDPSCIAGVVFFNNVGYLGMCGHGAIGVVVTLAHLGRIHAGRYALETPVGIVPFEYHGEDRVSIENVASYRHTVDVAFEVPGHGPIVGDVAWGGNWFFLTDDHGQELSSSRVVPLMDFTCRIREGLQQARVTGRDGQPIDHIEIFGPPHDPANHGRNFVLCPGREYDRSPCGTGTSAKLACLQADGKLEPGQVWRQEGILGTVFEGSLRIAEGRVLPRITGSAYVTAESNLLFDARDPFPRGIGG